MGNDGGSIPTRRELVKEAARRPTTSELRATRAESLAHHWRHCLLTGAPLAEPVVSDALGRLFNKDGVLEFLLSASSTEEADMRQRQEREARLGGTIAGLKDVVEVKFASEEGSKSWTCPITQKRLDEQTRAVYIVPCGHAFAEAAVKETMSGATATAEKGEVQADKPLCLQCSEPYAANDVIPILPTEELEVARLTLRLERLKEIGLSHSLKKAAGKKRKKTEATKDATAVEKKTLKHINNNISNADTASITARVMEEQASKKRKQNENLESLYSKKSAQSGKPGKNNDFMTRGYAPLPHNGR